MYEYKTEILPDINKEKKTSFSDVIRFIAESIDNYLLNEGLDGWELVDYSFIQGMSVYQNSNIEEVLITTKRRLE